MTGRKPTVKPLGYSDSRIENQFYCIKSTQSSTYQLFLFCGILIYALSLSGCLSSEAPPTQREKTPLRQQEIRENKRASLELDLRNLPSELKLDTVEVTIRFDHAFKRKNHRYAAIPFQPIVDYLVSKNRLNPDSTELILICKDGYTPRNTLADIYKHGGGYLAFKDLTLTSDQAEGSNLAEKYGPFYLVWKDIPFGHSDVFWPFGLISVRAVKRDSLQNLVFPTSDPQISHGFELFQHNCGKCHSINKVGGTLGPEFNYPRNITEYWKKEDIIAFAKNPQTFRYSSKMPAITNLTDQDFEEIIRYLTYISAYKISE